MLMSIAAGPVGLAVEGGETGLAGATVSTMLHEQLAEWPAGEAIVTRMELPANFKLGDHYHPGEEILYVMEGQARIHFPDRPDIRLYSGESARIPARQVHSGSAGPHRTATR